MRILVLIHEFPPIGGGGGRVALDICSGLSARGHDVSVITAHFAGLPREEVVQGVRVIRTPSLRREPHRAHLMAMGAFVLAGFGAGLKLIRRERPDIIHVHFAVPAGLVAWLLSRLTGVPYVLTAHLGDVPGGVPEKTAQWFRWVHPFTPMIWNDARHVVAVSEHTRQLARRHYPVEVQVIHNGVDLLALDPGEIRVHQPPIIIFAGRFVEQKNPAFVVRVMGSMKDLPWHCVMVGDGPLRANVLEEITRCRLEERFDLPGWLTPEQVVEWFLKGDILFMPSRSEGLPVVGVQALALGLAIVASRVGGFVDLVKDGENGALLDPVDGEAFAQALRILISSPARLLELRRRSREKAVEFDLRGIVSAYEEILFRCLQITPSSDENSSSRPLADAGESDQVP